MSCRVSEALERGTKLLQKCGVEDAQTSSENLLSHVLKRTKTALYVEDKEVISKEKIDKFFDLIKQRAGRYPLQYLIGKTSFRYADLKVGKGAFIPRPETEHLVDVVLDRIKINKCNHPRILDIGTGTGCVAISLALEIPDARVVATDKSIRSLRLAEKNAVASGVAKQIEFVHTNYWQGVSGKFDFVVSNPPYLSSEDLTHLQPEIKFEPKMALDGGRDGLRAYRYISRFAPQVLDCEGIAVFEVGINQASGVEDILKKSGFCNVWKTKDFSGIERIVSAQLRS